MCIASDPCGTNSVLDVGLGPLLQRMSESPGCDLRLGKSFCHLLLDIHLLLDVHMLLELLVDVHMLLDIHLLLDLLLDIRLLLLLLQ